MRDYPILWSFRRCPYAMRARLALMYAGVTVELREILLRDKPALFLSTSPKGTVPVLKTAAAVIDESFDVMRWGVAQNDPNGWLDMGNDGFALIAQADGPFKTALDHTKYASRHPELDVTVERAAAADFLHGLNDRLAVAPFLLGSKRRLADMAILPFVRQFAGIDRDWFYSQDWPHLIVWLDGFLASDLFASVMTKYAPWQPGQDQVLFGQNI